MHEPSGSLSSSPHSIAHSSTTRAAPTATPIFLVRLPEPATDYDRSGLTSFKPVGLTNPDPVGDSGIYTVRTGGRGAPSSPITGVGLGGLVLRTERTALGGLMPRIEGTVMAGLVPRNEHAVLDGLPLTSTDFAFFLFLTTRATKKG